MRLINTNMVNIINRSVSLADSIRGRECLTNLRSKIVLDFDFLMSCLMVKIVFPPDNLIRASVRVS